MRTAFVMRNARAGSAYPSPDIEAADLPGIAVALAG
jgi:hypothetical protein